MPSPTRSLLLALAVWSAASMLASCKGAGGEPAQASGDATATAPGRVASPNGVTLPLTSLVVRSAQGNAPVGADGRFTAIEPGGGGPATVFLTDADANVVMLGHVDTSDPSFNELSATSTAEEILFLATGAITLPRRAWPDVYRALAAAPETATLAGVIGARMAVSRTAVGDMDPAIVAAIDAAVASMRAAPSAASGAAHAAALPRLGPGGAPIASVVLASASGTGTGGLSVKTAAGAATPDPGLGLVVAPSDDRNGIVITNTTRINRFYFVYRTGYVPSTGQTTDPATPLAPWELVASGLLPSVSGLSGVTGTLVDFFSRKTTWAPVNTPTIPLALSPSDAVANTYQVFVVGMGARYIDSPSDLISKGDARLVRSTEQDMWIYQVVKEIMWPILTKFIPGTPATDVWATKDVVLSLANNFVKQAGSVGLAWQSQVMANPGEAWNATTTLIKAAVGGLAGQAQVRQALYGLACSLTRGSSIPSGTLDVLEKFVGNLYGAIKAVDAVMTGGDIGSIYYEVANSNNLNAWDVRAQTATLIMVPQSQTVNDPAQGVPFSVTVNGGPTASPASGSRSRYYNWSCGAFATLSDGKTTGSSIVASLSQAVTYKVTGTTLPSSPDTVTVTVFDPAGNEMGTVSGKVLFGNPWVGTWPGHVTSTCGYYSGPQTLRISSPGGNQLNFGVGYSGTFDGNTATSTNGKVVFTLDGNTIHGAEADSCQIGLYTRQ